MQFINDTLTQFTRFIQQSKICRIAYGLFCNGGIQY